MYSGDAFSHDAPDDRPSRFDLLCRALERVHDQYAEYRQQSALFASHFRDRLRAFLGAPEENVTFYARQGTFNGRKVDGPVSAMHLGDDACWHFGIVIDLYVEDSVFPGHSVGFNIGLKKLDQDYHLVIENLPPMIVQEGDDAQLEGVFEQMFEIVRSRYENSFQEFLKTGDSNRRFGF
jgi:hypothetical protein